MNPQQVLQVLGQPTYMTISVFGNLQSEYSGDLFIRIIYNSGITFTYSNMKVDPAIQIAGQGEVAVVCLDDLYPYFILETLLTEPIPDNPDEMSPLQVEHVIIPADSVEDHVDLSLVELTELANTTEHLCVSVAVNKPG